MRRLSDFFLATVVFACFLLNVGAQPTVDKQIRSNRSTEKAWQPKSESAGWFLQLSGPQQAMDPVFGENYTEVYASHTHAPAFQSKVQQAGFYFFSDVFEKFSSMQLNSRVLLITLFSLLVMGLLLFRFEISLNKLRAIKLEQTIVNQKLEQTCKDEALVLSEISEFDQRQRLLEQSGNLIFQDLLIKIDLLSHKFGEAESKMIQKALPKEHLHAWAKKLNEYEHAYLAGNSNYLNRIAERFPGLTSQERRLCVFFGQGMTNAEVAILTKKSIPTILTAKSRLRSNLGITDKALTLEEFLRVL